MALKRTPQKRRVGLYGRPDRATRTRQKTSKYSKRRIYGGSPGKKYPVIEIPKHQQQQNWFRFGKYHLCESCAHPARCINFGATKVEQCHLGHGRPGLDRGRLSRQLGTKSDAAPRKKRICCYKNDSNHDAISRQRSDIHGSLASVSSMRLPAAPATPFDFPEHAL